MIKGEQQLSSTATNKQTNQTKRSESARELHRPSYRRLSAKLVPTFEDRGCHVVSVMDSYGRILGFSRPEHAVA
jgi:hypothetical protein